MACTLFFDAVYPRGFTFSNTGEVAEKRRHETRRRERLARSLAVTATRFRGGPPRARDAVVAVQYDIERSF